jgi:sepiapterin reductase
MTRKVALIVTGASRGLGRAIVNAFAIEGSRSNNAALAVKHVTLMGRNERDLEDTKAGCIPTAVPVSIHAKDLSILNDLDETIDHVLSSIEKAQVDFDEVVLVNNAGSIGHIGLCIETPSLREIQRNVDMNVTSCIWISVRVARFAQEKGVRSTIVNISSLVALEPFSTLGVYSAGKAAREAYHAVMAKEGAPSSSSSSSSSSNLKVLNYAPGPLETSMTNEIRDAPNLAVELRPHYERKLVDPDDSARSLVRLLCKDEFMSGSHVDYFDLPQWQPRS